MKGVEIMACYHPLKAWKIGLTDKGKDKYKITSYERDWVCFSPRHNKYVSGVGSPPSWAFDAITDFIEIPCGHCLGCRIKYSKMWADRCMLEASYYDSNFFITLTYDNDHVHHSSWSDNKTGEVGQCFTLDKRDLQLFWKRLRKNSGQDIRYFACGEYGDKSMRPHYHAICFNLRLDDLKFYKRTKLGYNLYTSDFLNSCWKQGYVIVADVSWESCAYVSRYCMKKRDGFTAEYFRSFGMEPEFVLMSRRPGIGRKYYEDHKFDIYKTDELIYSTSDGGIKSRPPKYFDRLFEDECPELMCDIKDQRAINAVSLKEARLADCDVSYLDLLKRDELAKQEQIKYLKRLGI